MNGSCIVQTKYGTVSGELTGRARVWRGIPYAAPPAGELRFRKPLPPEPWEGERDATRFGPACPQSGRIKGRAEVEDVSEDCLTLNIWSPAEDGKKRAVLFYIHGGSFTEGAGSDAEYEGTNLVADGDILLVTINYRLGALGFMDFSFLGEGFLPNCGLWDTLAALRWVHENIGAFGGDPDNITICGQSAGATCVCLLTCSEDARNYFKRAIMMSAVTNLLHKKEQARDVARGYLDFLNIKDAGSLMAIPAAALSAGQAEYAQQSGFGTTTFAPCIDSELVKRYPICSALDGEIKGISMLLGTTLDEMSFALRKSTKHIVDIENLRRMAVSAERDDVRKRIRESYDRYGKRGPGIMFSDFTFRMPCVWFSEAQSGYADTWMYRFDYETLGMRISGLHSFHSCDIPFLFGNFKAGLARLMFLLAPGKRKILRLHREFKGDFITFVKTGELPWEKCDGEYGPAKCYAIPSFIEPAVPDDIRQTYEGSEFKRRSFTDEGMELHQAPADITS